MNDDELLRQLAEKDPNVSGLALGELVQRGVAAVPILVDAMGSGQVGVRQLAMEGLGTIADPAAAEVVRAGLRDEDGQVRSLAAVALARMNDPAALDALIDTLDDWPDELHGEMSRSAYELPRLGLPALTVAIPLLASKEWDGRARGIWVARAVLKREGDDPGVSALRDILRDFQPSADAAEREPAARAAADWLDASDLPKRR